MSRTKKLSIAFIVLAVIAVILGAVYSGFMGKRLESYALQISKCSFLNEQQCTTHPDCMPIFQPTADGQINEFVECKYLPKDATQELENAQNICQQTGGVWQETRYGVYCNCKVNDQTLQFVAGKGCQ